MKTRETIGIIGGGKMGGVLVQGILSRGIRNPQDLIVADVDSERLAVLHRTSAVRTTVDNLEAAQQARILILAVKPQMMGEVLDGIAGAVSPDKLVVSIAAGIPVAFITDRFEKGVRIVRVMPNTPALIGEGITALTAGPGVGDGDLAEVRRIFDAVGLTVVVKEEQMDAVTGLSGSGPAYGFTIIDALADGGVQMGLSREIAVKLAAQTLLGAARLVLTGDWHIGQLRDMVTSPGGTTIAGLRALEEGRLRATLMAAVEAATLRSQVLGGQKK